MKYLLFAAMYFVTDWAIRRKCFIISAIVRGDGDWQKYEAAVKYNPFDLLKVVFFLAQLYAAYLIVEHNVTTKWSLLICGVVGAPYIIYSIWLSDKDFKKACEELDKQGE